MNDDMTIGEKYGGVFKVYTVEKAKAYLRFCVEHTMSLKPEMSEASATKLELQNIGYYAGYAPPEDAERVMSLFNTEHPIFGKTTPTTEEALLAGKRLGEKQ